MACMRLLSLHVCVCSPFALPSWWESAAFLPTDAEFNFKAVQAIDLIFGKLSCASGRSTFRGATSTIRLMRFLKDQQPLPHPNFRWAFLRGRYYQHILAFCGPLAAWKWTNFADNFSGIVLSLYKQTRITETLLLVNVFKDQTPK